MLTRQRVSPATLLAVGALLLALSLPTASVCGQQAQTPAAQADQPSPPELGNRRKEWFDRVEAEIERQPEHASYQWYKLALEFTHAIPADPVGARQALDRMLAAEHGEAATHGRLAYQLLLNNEPRLAAEQARLSLEAKEPKQGQLAHYVLGEVSLRAGECKQALAEAEELLQGATDYPRAYLLKSLALSCAEQYEPAADSLQQFIALKSDDADVDAWREQLNTLRHLSAQGRASAPLALGVKDVTSRAVILSKPEPQFTEEARKANVSGEVVLRMVLNADGNVQDILVVKALSHGLTAAAVVAARKIAFTPAMKDGQPVPQYVTVAYNFNFY